MPEDSITRRRSVILFTSFDLGPIFSARIQFIFRTGLSS
jgi:hypothetical protein